MLWAEDGVASPFQGGLPVAPDPTPDCLGKGVVLPGSAYSSQAGCSVGFCQHPYLEAGVSLPNSLAKLPGAGIKKSNLSSLALQVRPSVTRPSHFSWLLWLPPHLPSVHNPLKLP